MITDLYLYIDEDARIVERLLPNKIKLITRYARQALPAGRFYDC